MEDGEEAPGDQVVDAAVVVGDLVERRASALVGMIAWWSPTLASLTTRAERQEVEPGDVPARLGVLAVAATCSTVGLISATMSLGQVARVRARIGERLVLLVAALGGGQRAPGGEPEAGVRLALQRGQVVQQRRALLARRLLELGDLARCAADRPDDRRRPPRRSSAAAGRRRGIGPRSPARRAANVASTSQYGSGSNARISSSRRARIASVGVCTRPSETAPSNEERRRIVAARVAFMPTIQSASERERAAASSVRELRPGRRCSKRLARSPPWSSRTATAAGPASWRRPSRRGRRRSARPRGRRRRR